MSDEVAKPGHPERPNLDSEPKKILDWIEALDIEYRLGQEMAAELSDHALDRALDELPRLTSAEQRAVLKGYEASLAGLPKPWGRLARILREGSATPGLQAIVADLVESGAFHKTSGKKPPITSKLVPTEVRHRVGMLKAILKRMFPESSRDLTAKAEALLAAEVRGPGETEEQALSRVEAARREGEKPVFKLIERVRRAVVVDQKVPGV